MSSIKVSKIQHNSNTLSNSEIILLGMHHATSKALFEGTNRRSEKLSGILIFALMKIFPFMISMPTFIISFFNYYTTELDEEAFQFALPLW